MTDIIAAAVKSSVWEGSDGIITEGSTPGSNNDVAGFKSSSESGIIFDLHPILIYYPLQLYSSEDCTKHLPGALPMPICRPSCVVILTSRCVSYLSPRKPCTDIYRTVQCSFGISGQRELVFFCLGRATSSIYFLGSTSCPRCSCIGHRCQ